MESVGQTPISTLMESSLKISSRVLTPFQESDSTSLSFAAVALTLSFLFSWLGFGDRQPLSSYSMLELPSPKENEIEESIMKIRNNLIFQNNDGSIHLTSKQGEPKVTIDEYEKALKAFEKFMKWSAVESKDSQFLEDVLELAISKAKGQIDPSDVFYDYAMLVFEDLYNKTRDFIHYYFS